MPNDTHLPTLYQAQIHASKYSRWREEDGRRETWPETVDRYITCIEKQAREVCGYTIAEKLLERLREAIMTHRILPSMRLLMTAGEAVERDNVANFNCAFLAINRIQAFPEAMFILMCGTGVGFSVERHHVAKLPEVPDLHDTDTMIVVADSKQGWSQSFRQLLSLLYGGSVPKWDTSKVRPAGTRLKTFGGRASGPEPLEDLFRYTVETFRGAQGRRLTDIECHGIMCKIGDIVVVGGVRRSALISLSDLDSSAMRDAKMGAWHISNPEFALANNSAVYERRPTAERFLDEWTALVKSKSGERGILNREALTKKVRSIERRDPSHEFGTNPCSEIILRDRQFCNLSEIVVRAEDTYETLMEKVELATVLGTIQASFTNFRYLSPTWSKNCQEEALLGVSMTGIMDNRFMAGQEDWDDAGFDEAVDLDDALEALRAHAVGVNRDWAKRLNINPAAAITCVKPSGNGSQKVNSASGIHARHAPYYLRTNRGNKNDPVAQFLNFNGVPCEDEIGHPDSTWVFTYPMKAPEGAITRHDLTAVEHLRLWLVYARHWCEHKPSITVSVREHEWLEVGAFVYEHFDEMSGVSFLPMSDHSYQQAPYQDITEEEYEAWLARMPAEEDVDWSLLAAFETEDQTTGSHELACVGSSCEIA